MTLTLEGTGSSAALRMTGLFQQSRTAALIEAGLQRRHIKVSCLRNRASSAAGIRPVPIISEPLVERLATSSLCLCAASSTASCIAAMTKRNGGGPPTSTRLRWLKGYGAKLTIRRDEVCLGAPSVAKRRCNSTNALFVAANWKRNHHAAKSYT